MNCCKIPKSSGRYNRLTIGIRNTDIACAMMLAEASLETFLKKFDKVYQQPKIPIYIA